MSGNTGDVDPDRVLDFWFDEIAPASWWRRSADFDALIRSRFLDLNECAAAGELYGWRSTGRGRLAEIIVLDQFSRNLYRDSARAFACDAMALALAQEAVAGRCDRDLTSTERNFLYMPFMHSESLPIHEVATMLFAANGVESTIGFEARHRAIIERFGRYPHRNAVLGRHSTPEEVAFLAEPGSGF